MNLKEGLMKVIASHPKAVTLGIGLAIAAAVGIGLGAVGAPEQAFAGGGAWASSTYCKTCGGGAWAS